MDAKKCDRCGLLYEKYTAVEKYIPGNGVHLIVEKASGESIVMSTFDLCPKCMAKVFDFLYNQKKEFS